MSPALGITSTYPFSSFQPSGGREACVFFLLARLSSGMARPPPPPPGARRWNVHWERSFPSNNTMASEGGPPGWDAGVTTAGCGRSGSCTWYGRPGSMGVSVKPRSSPCVPARPAPPALWPGFCAVTATAQLNRATAAIRIGNLLVFMLDCPRKSSCPGSGRSEAQPKVKRYNAGVSGSRILAGGGVYLGAGGVILEGRIEGVELRVVKGVVELGAEVQCAELAQADRYSLLN